MSNYNYNINSTKLARKLIQSCSTALLIGVLQACSQPSIERINDSDRQELQRLLDDGIASSKKLREVA